MRIAYKTVMERGLREQTRSPLCVRVLPAIRNPHSAIPSKPPLPYDKRAKDVLARRIRLCGERRLADEVARDVAQLEAQSPRHPMLEPNAERVFVRGLGLQRH